MKRGEERLETMDGIKGMDIFGGVDYLHRITRTGY
jgi:hypothetical protein